MKNTVVKLQDRVEIASAPSVLHNDVEVDKDIKKLLDAISSIIADEYIQIAKENPDVFKDGGEK